VNAHSAMRPFDEIDDSERSVISSLNDPPTATKVTQFLSRKLLNMGVEARGAYLFISLSRNSISDQSARRTVLSRTATRSPTIPDRYPPRRCHGED
jgi:hypothetical protein